MFRVLFAGDGLPASPDIYPDAQTANAAAAAIRAENPGKPVRIARVVTEAWRERELARLNDGTYRPLPEWWAEEVAGWAGSVAECDHYAHLSENGRDIAYTQSPEKGEADRQARVAVTTYLGRYFPHIPGNRIAEIAARLAGQETRLEISNKPEDFARVYRRSPSVLNESSRGASCMRQDSLSNRLPHHPAWVYGASDLSIAYLRTDAAEPDRVTARAIIWPDRETFVRVYGETIELQDMLRGMLERQGYRRADSFAGARLLKVKAGYGYLMPYVDGGEDWAEDYGGHFEIGADYPCARISIKNTSGVSELEDAEDDEEDEEDTFACEGCGDSTPESEMRTVCRGENLESWCSHCARHDAFTCEATGALHADSELVEVNLANGRTADYSESAAEDYAFRCARTEEYYADADFTQIEVIAPDGSRETWCLEAAQEDHSEAEPVFYFCPVHRVYFTPECADVPPAELPAPRIADDRQLTLDAMLSAFTPAHVALCA